MEISFTRYRIYRECPEKYRLIFLEGRRLPPDARSSFGLSLHRALESWLSRGDGTREGLLDALDADWLPAGYAGEAEESRWRAKAERVLSRFFEEESARRSRIAGLEREFVWPLGRHEVRGMIDRVDQRPDGSYELIDYKTGPASPEPARVAEDLQLRFYALGARRGLGLPAAWLTVDAVAAGGRVSVPYEPSGEEALAADIEAAAEAIEAGRFAPERSFCPRCGFRRECASSSAREPE